MKCTDNHTDCTPHLSVQISAQKNGDGRSQRLLEDTTLDGFALSVSSRSARLASVESSFDFTPPKSLRPENDELARDRDVGLDETENLLGKGVMAISLLSLIAIVHILLCSQ